jgi:hypothetical protein
MAQVSRSPAVQADLKDKIDHYLDYELGAWQSVPEYAARWPEMDPVDREAFHLHWKGVTESYLSKLERWAGEGWLGTAQLLEYRRLQALIAQHRPTLEALLAD